MNRTLFNTLTCLARMLMIPVCCFLFFQCGRIKTVRETPAAGELRLPAIFSDNMVLQRDKIIQIWGWDAPGEKVVIILDGKTWSGKAGSDGRWSVAIGPLSAGGPWTLNISDSIKIIAFKNVLAGEVWACSGQSNMEMHIGDEWGKVLDYEREIAESDYPQIRLITIPHQISFTPQPDANTDGWVECSPKTSPSFSAAAYFFGREIHKRYGVPVGLIHSSFGGTPIESWISADSLRVIPEFASDLEKIGGLPPDMETAKRVYETNMAAWKDEIEKCDAGMSSGVPVWAKPTLDVSDWQTMQLPSQWEPAGLPNFDGVVWFYKKVSLPREWAGKHLVINLGAIDDEDKTYFNGELVGAKEIFFENRRYEIPAALAREGENTIAIRVLDTGGPGGFTAKPEDLHIHCPTAGGNARISLAGEWHYKPSLDLKTLPPRPFPPDYSGHPAVLFNGMISPILPYGIRGVIWYQGESNAGRARQYRTLFPLLIRDWRGKWGAGDFPFLFVQLANFGAALPEPAEDAWAELREAQTMALAEPNTGMAVAIDIGDAADIHPRNKQEVGRRLALAARKIAYGEKITHSGPIYKKDSLKIENGGARVFFDYADGGLVSKNGEPLTGFAIAGADKKFYWADARIEGESVFVRSEKVAHPAAVRFGWAGNPSCNLYNGAGLPASPFRTDDWQGVAE